MGDLPPKLFFRIGEVAGLVGVEPHVLRYWEREFRSIRPTKSAKGQRVYSRKDVENLLRVRDLLYRDGFTIAGAKKKLQRPEGDESPDAEELDAGAGAAGPCGEALMTAEVVDTNEAEPRMASASDVSPAVRETLVALRGEIEAFLLELSSPPRR